ncbi:MAG: glycosyltransferase, partial [Anaerolineae bacterium]
NDVGGFDPGVDGAQDWDLSLRLVEKTRQIHHIPRVFYHWRQVVGSAARDANAKPWAFAAQERCLRQHLQRQGYENVQISFPRLGTVRLIWPSHNAKVSIIIPTKNNLPLLQACLDSILTKTTYPFYEILVVDNQSDDPAVAGYYQEVSNHPRIRILDYPHPYNFQKINNWAAGQCDGEVLLFLNNDTEVIEPTWLEEMAGWAMRPETGVVGTKLLRPNGKIQHAGLVIGLIGHGSHVFEDCDDHVYTHFGSINWYRNYQAMTGACMAVRRSVFDELHGLDEVYVIGFGDIDICLRAQTAGYRNVYTPFAALLHHEGGTRGLSLPPSDVLRATVKMWTMVQEGDGYFNPNLSYSSRQPVVSAMKEEDRGKRLVRIMTTFGLIDRGMGLSEWKSVVAGLPHEMTKTTVSRPFAPHKPMSRILLVTHELTRSGAPIIMWMLARYLHEKGYNLQVVSPVNGALRQDYEAEGIPVSVAASLLRDGRTILPYLAKADVVICNTILSWRTVHAARAFAKPCLWWVHETAFGVKLAAEQPPIAQAFAAATRVVFPSQTTADQYRTFARQDNFVALLHGFNVTVPETAVPSLLNKQPDEMHIVCVATIEKRKGQDLLLQAIASLPHEIKPKIHCHLIGRKRISPLYYLKVAWHARRQKNIHLLGELPNHRVLQYIQEADVFVMASRDEALPVVLTEAMA